MKAQPLLVRFAPLWLLMAACGMVQAVLYLVVDAGRWWKWFAFVCVVWGGIAFLLALLRARGKK